MSRVQGISSPTDHAVEGYLTDENAHPSDPTVGVRLGSWGGPLGGWMFSYERGTPVG